MMRSNGDLSVSVVMPTRSRAHALEVTWQSYLQPEVGELIFVDDASTDSTPQFVQALADQSPIPVRYVRNERPVLQPTCRNIGIETARGRYVLMGEDDVFLGTNYISGLLGYLEKGCCAAAAGRLIPLLYTNDLDLNALNRTITSEPVAYSPDAWSFDVTDDLAVEHATEVNGLHMVSLIDARVFQRTRFDPWYGRWSSFGEETDFYLSLRGRGLKLLFVPDVTCYHLRGDIARLGGARAKRYNRLQLEIVSIWHTWHLIYKHWSFLKREYELQGTPLQYALQYVFRRERQNLRELVGIVTRRRHWWL